MLADVMTYHYKKNVLLVDCDPQANLSQMVMSYIGLKQAKSASKTITRWIEGFGSSALVGNGALEEVTASATISANVSGLKDPMLQIQATNRGQLAIWAATPDLRFAELAFDHLNYNGGDKEGPRRALTEQLSQALESMGSAYDFVIFDCPPGFSTLAQSAFTVSDFILSPLNVDRVSLWSLRTFWEQGLDEVLGLEATPRHAFLTLVQGRRGADQEKLLVREELRRFTSNRVMSNEIPYSSQALRFVHRPHPDSMNTFNAKYSHIKSKVRAFGKEALTLISNTTGAPDAKE